MVECESRWVAFGAFAMLSACTVPPASDGGLELGTGNASDPVPSPPPVSTTGGATSGPTTPPTTGSDATTAPAPMVGSSGDGEPVVFDVAIVDAPIGVPEDPTDIDVVLTADNAYAFGYGDENGMTSYHGGVENTLACHIFCCADGPEEYTVPADAATGAAYLYIIGYADNATTQGVLGQFRRVSGQDGGGFGAVVYTGDPGWEVCATGVDYQPGGGAPTLEAVNEEIQRCNAGDGDAATTSQGWVDEIGTSLGALAVGEANDTPYDGSAQPGNEFPLVCHDKIDPEAHWMWFNWDPDNIEWPTQTPFIFPYGAGANPMHDFMVFRLAASNVPSPEG